ncbi:hypothetical protein KVR01_005882 [Diaporthe batatas]|uniref:uncharacterized protein n=1 Tax=Diaporthe batatas TaxID=748121 RepID=UPI001D055F86|nr:uncharacterized protein KVR01_005882 [Diaporthe batatas]KAG8163964.1 hypothetical protein KVR01_005882 [Diaporthe batatas]
MASTTPTVDEPVEAGSNMPPQSPNSVRIPNTRRITDMPQLGLGTYLTLPEWTFWACTSALNAGYRHIDTAQYYGNEAQVGEAIRKSWLNRQDIFVTTKILEPGDTPEATYNKCIESVKKIDQCGRCGRCGWVDCFLIHSPNVDDAKTKEMWLALERLYNEGKARAIGVSNFGKGQIEGLKGVGNVWPPHVNQIELHPWHQQREIVQYCRDNGIVVQAYSPLARNEKAGNRTLCDIAARNGVLPSQVLVRWSVQKGWVSLPKSHHPGRIRENGDVFGFELSPEDEALLDGLDQGAAGCLVHTVVNE